MTNVIDKSWFFNEVKKDNEEDRLHDLKEQEILETLGMTVWKPLKGFREFVVDIHGNEVETTTEQEFLDALLGFDDS